ncbi:MAG: hypothetical protein JWL92_572, partial [Candidatus Nomurabacteria bacterium]|nr:hypothetical protein [Candidatus Nomurabacteria bacterium]
MRATACIESKVTANVPGVLKETNA